MYEIVFKCTSCSTHLSASADDAGYEFECPACGNRIAVPTGDILFSCPQCEVHILASRDVVGESFDCPQCQQSVLVPPQGKQVIVPDRPAIMARAVDTISANPTTTKETAPTSQALENTTDPSDRQFMTTWGDYLAAAGLTNDNDENSQKRKRGEPPA